MRFILLLTTFLWSLGAYAISCDCEIMVYAPMTGSHSLPPSVLKTYHLEEFNGRSRKNQLECRESCVHQFYEDMPNDRLTALLLTYSERMIKNKVLGYNCTGTTTLKYPIRVKAVLGNRGLGNVADFIQTVNHDESCFY